MPGRGHCCFAMYLFFGGKPINDKTIEWIRNKLAVFMERNAEFFKKYWIQGKQSMHLQPIKIMINLN